MSKQIALWILIQFVAGGCTAIRPPIIRLASQFDLAEAQQMLTPGKNTITGSALVRQRGGGIATCAGNKVRLIPVTDYATERMQKIYGSDQKGFFSVSTFRTFEFDPDYPEYWNITRTITADAQGAFEFDSVADGEFYVVTTITWIVNSLPPRREPDATSQGNSENQIRLLRVWNINRRRITWEAELSVDDLKKISEKFSGMLLDYNKV